MLSGVAKFTTIITIMVVTCECLEAARDTIDNGSLGVGSKTNNTKTILDSKPVDLTSWNQASVKFQCFKIKHFCRQLQPLLSKSVWQFVFFLID